MIQHGITRREFLKGTAMTAGALAIAACAPVATAPAGEEAAAEPAEPAQAATTLAFWDWFLSREPFYQAMTKQWSETYNPEVAWDIVFVPGDEYWTKLFASVPAGTGPDVFRVHAWWMTDMIENKFVVPLPEDKFPISVLKEEFQGVQEGLFTYKDGNTYWLSDGAIGPIIVANKTMWDEAGLTDDDIPGTFDELFEVAKALTKTDAQGEITQAGFGTNGHNWEWFRALMYQQGMFHYTPDAKGVQFDSEAGRFALQMIEDCVSKHNINSRTALEFTEGFGTEMIAMTWAWTWWAGFMQASYPDVEYFSFPVPGLKPENNPAYGVTVWELSIVANNESPPERKDLAWDFLEWYFMNDEHTYLIDAAEVIAAVPSKIKLQSDPRVVNNPMAQALTSRLDRMVYMGDEVQGITTMLQRYVDQSLVQGGEDLETVVQGIQTEGDQVMQEKDYWILERDYKYADEFQS